MRRPVLVVLLLTFVALVAATLWVPCRPVWLFGVGVTPLPSPAIEWRWIGDAWTPPPLTFGTPVPFSGIPMGYDIDSTVWVVEYALIVALGGLVALALHTRAKRRSVTA